MRTQLGLVEGLPLASGSQDIKDRVCTAAIRDTGSSAAKTMGVDRDWKPWLQDCPQFIGNPKCCRRPVIWRPLTTSFLRFFFTHTSYFIRLSPNPLTQSSAFLPLNTTSS